jgi:FkbH-like protein
VAVPSSADDRRAAKTRLRHAAEIDDLAAVRAATDELLGLDGGAATYSFADRVLATAAVRLELPMRSIALLASYTIAPLVPYLGVELFRSGWASTIEVVQYGGWSEYLLEATAPADDVVLLLRPEDVLPRVTDAFLSDADAAGAEAESFVGLLAGALAAFRDRSASTVHVASLAPMAREAERHFGHAPTTNRRLLIDRVNEDVAAVVADLPGLFVYPFAALVADHGRTRFFDRARSTSAMAPIHASAYPILARDLAHYLDNAWGPRRKLIALDADGTLWGGVLGEDGIAGIELGFDGAGKAYRDLQLTLKELHATGVLLAVVSKNDEALVRAAFDEHPAMALAWDDLAAVSIGWGDKVSGILAVADELGIGVDSFVFVDDSPIEIDFVRAQLPGVAVIAVPERVDDLPAQLLAGARLEPPRLSADDRSRTTTYAVERDRRATAARFDSIDDYLRSLELQVDVVGATSSDLPRLAQLAGKTNQFNASATRYDEAALESFRRDPAHLVLRVDVTDRFGAYGTTGLLVAHREDEAVVVDNVLLSCRVLGRRVEEALLDVVSDHARDEGARDLVVLHRRTDRNGQVTTLLSALGFELAESSTTSDGFEHWHRPTVRSAASGAAAAMMEIRFRLVPAPPAPEGQVE